MGTVLLSLKSGDGSRGTKPKPPVIAPEEPLLLVRRFQREQEN